MTESKTPLLDTVGSPAELRARSDSNDIDDAFRRLTTAGDPEPAKAATA